ncbi:nucleotidyltransferase domain-containing protein [Streptomyces xiamenensis]|uniref:nucleotidyltransferase domain-containing protein n=1 Tax=Streptomyces xiamenensis TaxID=408015 RepID=UPI00341226CE
MDERGLNPDGTIAREGSPARVAEPFRPVVAAARERIGEVFGGSRLHSAYLYGSIPRGTAVPGISDLDLQLALHHEPTPRDRADARALESALDTAFPQIDGAGVLLDSRRALLAEHVRYDAGFFLACLCTPLLGPDLAAGLPRYRPTSLLARETNGGLARTIPRWRAEAAGARTDAARRALSRRVARRLVRTAFTLVMPRWGGWTSDLVASAEIFGRYYPRRAAQVLRAAAIGRQPCADPAALRFLIEEQAPWLAAEYAAVHGVPAPR